MSVRIGGHRAGLAISAALLLGAPAFASQMNFDDQATAPSGISGIELTNQYAPVGVVFSGIAATQSFKFNVTPSSSPNYATPFGFGDGPVGQFSFVDPSNSSLPAFVNQVSFTLLGLTTSDVHPGNYSGATIDALDENGNVILGQTQIIPAATANTSNTILTFSGQVHAIRFTQTGGTTGVLPFDDVTFGAIAPEPATFGFFGAALVGLGVMRRRRG